MNNRKIIVVHTATHGVAPWPHVLFVAGSAEAHVTDVLAASCQAPVLTISDADRSANRGGVIGLVLEDHAVHFAVNRTAAEEARLPVPAQLLHLAVPLFSATSPCVGR